MNLTDLTREEQLALGGLVRMMIRADGEFSSAEEERIDAIGEELGSRELLWKIISDSAQAFRDDAAVKAATVAVSRSEARELILSVLTSVAIADAMSSNERTLLDGVKSTWGIVDAPDGTE
jgi:hypothetical protein